MFALIVIGSVINLVSLKCFPCLCMLYMETGLKVTGAKKETQDRTFSQLSSVLTIPWFVYVFSTAVVLTFTFSAFFTSGPV